MSPATGRPQTKTPKAHRQWRCSTNCDLWHTTLFTSFALHLHNSLLHLRIPSYNQNIMNLELLDPFGRQIPDRIDSTLQLQPTLHFRHHDGVEPRKKGEPEDQEWKAAYHVSFNRRGTYLAVGYGSGAVGVHNFLSRTLSSLYRNEDPTVTPGNLKNGATSVTWSRRSRTLLVGAAGDAAVQLFDTTHPYGPEESCLGLFTDGDGDEDASPKKQAPPVETNDVPPPHSWAQTKDSSLADEISPYVYLKERKDLATDVIHMGGQASAQQVRRYEGVAHSRPLNKYPSVAFQFPDAAVGGSLQVNPRRATGGLAALTNGSLVLFWVHASVWVDGDGYVTPKVQIAPLWEDSSHFITCAHFDPSGKKVYAATKQGSLMGFDVENLWNALCGNIDSERTIPVVKPSFTIPMNGSSSAWHLLVSRNGKYVVVNSADGALRLFSTQDCWENPSAVEKPTFVFQDVVSKVKFASCDLSGDGEYIVGGANGDDNKYELYIWNTSTGALMDKLTGASVQLYSVAWHPTRSFLAVATSDGLVDIWGPRINWTAFAPDFQALPKNVEYVEREDEFDVDKEGKYLADKDQDNQGGRNENTSVDVMTIDPVPVFASDSEDEEEVFAFETRIKNLTACRQGAPRGRPPNVAED